MQFDNTSNEFEKIPARKEKKGKGTDLEILEG